MPVMAKGVMCPEDAILALSNGADVIYVSNHGGRQLDTTPATIEVLPDIIKTVKSINRDIPVWFDGGIRTGEDVYKAIALGADLVLIGRPILWGLACGGAKGVKNVL
jgi:isopentenyl diphosphate isomerase/L-lactate dehydrogenase-like FMN-dependent dehydrogenase